MNNPDKIRIYPVEGRKVVHNFTGESIPPEGMEVIKSPYWLRRLKEGDITTKAVALPHKKEEKGNK